MSMNETNGDGTKQGILTRAAHKLAEISEDELRDNGILVLGFDKNSEVENAKYQ